jgi:uncharacterized protein YjlB
MNMSKGSTQHFLIIEADTSPNNGELPLILYKAAVQFGDKEPESVFEEIFWGNAWADGFRDGTFPFHHYHSAAHEVVGVARGRAVLQFGGPTGPVVEVKAGDAAVIPAGVVHRRIDDAPGFSVVGAYPHHQVPDCCVLSESDARIAEVHPDAVDLVVKFIGETALAAIKASISATVLPETDPLSGTGGPIADLWLNR